MAKIAINIHCVLNWSNEYARMLVMQTLDNKTSFPIIIAENEAASLLKELEKIEVNRPQTHDLFFIVMQTFDISVQEVYIHELVEGIFYTRLICNTNGKTVNLDARPSDAIILAIKSDAPIFVEDTILNKLGVPTAEMERQIISPQEYNQQYKEQGGLSFEDMTTQELKKILGTALEEEDFETAAKIRDILYQRKEKL